jgi:hypothetical protein
MGALGSLMTLGGVLLWHCFQSLVPGRACSQVITRCLGGGASGGAALAVPTSIAPTMSAAIENLMPWVSFMMPP